MSTLAERYAQVKGGLKPGVELVAVSKTRTVAEIQALYDLGHRAFGENYPQELAAKQPQLPADIQWHFIGHLQTNKVKLIAPFVHLVHAVDSTRLLDELEKRSGGRTMGVLLQAHIAQEETKHGLSEDELTALMASWSPGRWAHVQLRGLMGMATNTDDRTLVRREFTGLQQLFATFQQQRGDGPFDTLSMGMSGDADLAMAAGSTLVRIGTAIFGERG
ncbi:MAG TPA: YggS family pyridoxal phosphate-dependent enzyme [Flavobacteriales bacterium]|jgi:hypothetical protein|nr:YggS family pyridoxal phosphate-dependent enzyme [Flavobacteriales bacterium]